MSEHVDPTQLASSSGLERRAMMTHLLDCAVCRSRAVAYDPSALFGLLALTPLPKTLLDEVSSTVARRAGSETQSFGALALPAAWPRRAAAAAILVLTLLTGYATFREQPEAEPPETFFSRRADVEVESGRGVSQVIDLTVGETQIVMVYNGDLKL